MKTFIVALLLTCSSFALAQSNDMDTSTSMPSDNPNANVDKKVDEKPFSITPSVQLLNFPHPFDGAVEMVFSQAIGIKYSRSFRPHGSVDGSDVDLDNQSIAVRSYVDRGPWFLGVAYGQHEMNVNRHDVVNGFDVNSHANVKSEYITPMTGWKWVYNSGFTVGLEFGWIFPFNSQASVSSDQDYNPLVNANDDYRKARRDAEDTANRFVKNGAPDIGLLEIGWTF